MKKENAMKKLLGGGDCSNTFPCHGTVYLHRNGNGSKGGRGMVF